jgi:hypothetical protein
MSKSVGESVFQLVRVFVLCVYIYVYIYIYIFLFFWGGGGGRWSNVYDCICVI